MSYLVSQLYRVPPLPVLRLGELAEPGDQSVGRGTDHRADLSLVHLILLLLLLLQLLL